MLLDRGFLYKSKFSLIRLKFKVKIIITIIIT
jgi:hypothetical protein